MTRLESASFCAGLLTLTVAAYLPLWHNGFVDFDDELYITANPHVTGGLTPSGFAWAWTNCDHNYWQPISWLSLQADATFFSAGPPQGPPVLSPAAFHGQSLFWHGASVLLLFGLWYRLTGVRWRSALVAALFAVHPMHVESVAWAAERKDVLSVFFGLLTLWAYVLYLEKPGGWRYLALTAAYLLSLLSKPMLMTLPFVLLLLDYWPLRRTASPPAPAVAGRHPPLGPASAGRLVLEKVPLFIMAGCIAVITVVARDRAGAAMSLKVLPLSARLANALTAYGWYLGTTFWPVRLAVLYPHPMRNWSAVSALAGAGALLAVTALAFWQARRRGWLVVGWLWFVGALLPVIGLAQGGEQAWADRFSYWPHIGLFVAVAWGLGEAVGRLRIPAPAAGLAGAGALGGLAALTWVQVGSWHDTRTLWERALAVTAGNARAHANLGRYDQDRGRLDEAAAHFAEAVRLRPDAPEYHFFRGVSLLALGKLDEAAGQFEDALGRDPRHADAWHDLGVTRLRQGRPDAAARCFQRALDLRPGAADSLSGLGLALWRAGKRAEGVEALQAALRRNPLEAQAWHGLGVAYLADGREERAIEAFGKALRFNPDMTAAYSDLGVALDRRGRPAEAVPYHAVAVRLQEGNEKALKAMNGQVPASDSVPPAVVYRCRLASTLNRLGEGRAAEAEYRAALGRDPLWPAKFLLRAWALATDPDVNHRDPRLASELASQAFQATVGSLAGPPDATAGRPVFEEMPVGPGNALTPAGPLTGRPRPTFLR